MALPAISTILRCRETSLWSHDRVAGLFPVFFPDIHVYVGNRHPNGIGDSLLLMPDSFQSAFQGFLSRFTEIIGLPGECRRILLTKVVRYRDERSRHHSMKFMELAAAVGCPGKASMPEPQVEPKGESHLAIFPGARFGPAKKWPYFGRLAESLSLETGLPVVMYGSRDEREELSSMFRGGFPMTIETGLDIPALASRLLAAVLTVGNDSGGVHLSAALGTPTMAIFGSTRPAWTAPIGTHTTVLASSLKCSPCFKRECPGNNTRCLREITVETVLKRAMELMKKCERGSANNGG